MRSAITDALSLFAGRWWDAPYDFDVTGHGEHTIEVDPATCQSGFAAPRLSGLAHHVTGLAYASETGHTQVAARFLCGEGSADVVIVPEPADDDAVCVRCIRHSKRYPALYRLFGADGRLLYIGATVDVIQRFGEHEKRTPWWAEVAEKQIERFDSIADARIAEARAIRNEEPLYNKILHRDGRSRRAAV